VGEEDSWRVKLEIDGYLRNSRILGVLCEIVHGPIGRIYAVEIAGKGIAAEARCTISAMDDKLHSGHGGVTESVGEGIEYADRLIELGAIEDDLVDLWRRRCGKEVADEEFEAELRAIVVRLEDWPQ
jgi:hypothetical protein